MAPTECPPSACLLACLPACFLACERFKETKTETNMTLLHCAGQNNNFNHLFRLGAADIQGVILLSDDSNANCHTGL